MQLHPIGGNERSMARERARARPTIQVHRSNEIERNKLCLCFEVSPDIIRW